MLLKIDMREGSLIGQIQLLISGSSTTFQNIKVEICALPLGDIIIMDETTDTEVIIIERKSIADLMSSIKDGRYAEQSYRLSGIDHPNHNIIYLIEGDIDKYAMVHKKDNIGTIYSSIFSICYFKGFSLMRSKGVAESAFIICNMIDKLTREHGKRRGYYTGAVPTGGIGNDIVVPTSPEGDISASGDAGGGAPTSPEGGIEEPCAAQEERKYCEVVKRNKKANITVENMPEIILCQIPHVSHCTAIAIVKKYSTISLLMKALAESRKCLDEITISTTDGTKIKERKISKLATQNIVTYLI